MRLSGEPESLAQGWPNPERDVQDQCEREEGKKRREDMMSKRSAKAFVVFVAIMCGLIIVVSGQDGAGMAIGEGIFAGGVILLVGLLGVKFFWREEDEDY